MTNYEMAFSFGIATILAGVIFLIAIFISEKKHKKLMIIKTDPCQVETLMEARELLESGTDCDPIEVRDIEASYKIPDDVDEFSIHYNTVGLRPQPEPKHYKRNSDGIFKQVYK